MNSVDNSSFHSQVVWIFHRGGVPAIPRGFFLKAVQCEVVFSLWMTIGSYRERIYSQYVCIHKTQFIIKSIRNCLHSFISKPRLVSRSFGYDVCKCIKLHSLCKKTILVQLYYPPDCCNLLSTDLFRCLAKLSFRHGDATGLACGRQNFC